MIKKNHIQALFLFSLLSSFVLKKIYRREANISQINYYIYSIVLAFGQIIFSHSSLVWPALNTNLHGKREILYSYNFHDSICKHIAQLP